MLVDKTLYENVSFVLLFSCLQRMVTPVAIATSCVPCSIIYKKSLSPSLPYISNPFLFTFFFSFYLFLFHTISRDERLKKLTEKCIVIKPSIMAAAVVVAVAAAVAVVVVVVVVVAVVARHK